MASINYIFSCIYFLKFVHHVMFDTKSSGVKLCCDSCLPKPNSSRQHHKIFESGHKILQEFRTFTLELKKRPSCIRRLSAISNMLTNCEMELMCQYCFCYLEKVNNSQTFLRHTNIQEFQD